MLTREKLPLTFAAVVGANCTVNEAVFPAASVSGRVGPVKEKPVPVRLSWKMVTLAVLAVTVTVCEELVPVVTLPKLSDAGLAVSWPPGVTPAPASDTVSALEELLTREKLPVALAVVVGAKVRVKEAVFSAARVSGRVGPVKEKPVPVRLAWEMVTLVALAVTMTVCEELVPVVTLPKLSDAGLAVNWPTGSTPVPVNTTALGELLALLFNDSVALTVPAVVGANVTV